MLINLLAAAAETAAQVAEGATHVAAEGGEHGAGHDKVFPPLDTTTFASQLIWLTFTLGALYFIMSRIALPRIGEVIEERRARIQRDLDEAERFKADTEKAIASYEQALAEAKGNAHTIAQSAREKVAGEVEVERAKVDAQLAGEAGEAEARIAASRRAAMAEVASVATETSQAIVERLLGASVSGEDARQAVASVTGAN